MSSIRRVQDLGPFHELLIRACPPVSKAADGSLEYDPVNGVKSMSLLAKQVGMSRWGVFKWVKNGRIPALQAKRIAELPHQEIALEEFSPYVYAGSLAGGRFQS